MYSLIDVLEKFAPDVLKKISEEEMECFLHNIQTAGNNCICSMVTKLTSSELALIHTSAVYPQLNDGNLITVVQAAARLGVSAPAVSRTLKNLESKGYILREVNPDDRRSVHISVTESGIVAMTECIVSSVKIVSEALEDFTEEELRTMIKLHNKLTTNMTKVISQKKEQYRKEKTNA